MKKRSIIILSVAIGLLAITGSAVLFLYPRNSAIPINPDDISILALGDSYTVGESVPTTQSWPIQLKNKAIDHNLNITQLDVIAQTGWTSHDLLLNVTNTSFNTTYDFVIILIGANDQFQGVQPEIYKSNLMDLFTIASTLTYSVQNVIVISIPDYSISPLICGRAKTVVREEINALNFRNSQASSLIGTSYLDITDIVRTYADDLSMLAEDRLHFSGKMYNLWVKEIFSLLQVLIGESTSTN